jgi:predicted transcriptional regulator
MTRRKKKLEPMSIRLDPDVKAALQGFAEEEERSLSFYVNRVLRNHVERVEAEKQEAPQPEARKPEPKEPRKRPPERA